MGGVYSAEHLALKRHVALKMMHADLVSDKELLDRFVREVQEQAAIDHPGIVDVYDAGIAKDGSHYLVMEKLDGDTLHNLIHKEGPFDVTRAATIAVGVLDVLAAIHDNGLIHRDIKPLNVFLSCRYGQQQVKILDFGVVKAKDGKALTQLGQEMGSLIYIAPEQIMDSRSVDIRADIFSAGVMLFEMLTKTYPVPDSKPHLMRTAILTGKLVRNVRHFRPELPEWIDAVVAKALQTEREDRHANAREMIAALMLGIAPAPASKSWLQRVLNR